MNKTNASKGFSMLEMGISMTIIAMMVAAVVAGNNMKDQLELNQIVEDISSISTAVKEFKNTYGAYPGDMFDAEDKLGAANTDDGNGDGDLGTSEGTDANTNETLLFWQQLSAAGFIEGAYDGITDGIGGRMEAPVKKGLYGAIKTAGNPIYITVGKAGDEGLFTTKQAFDFDSKYDDGNPTTGNIQAADGASETAEDCVNVTADPDAYTLSNADETPCVMHFYIEQ